MWKRKWEASTGFILNAISNGCWNWNKTSDKKIDTQPGVVYVLNKHWLISTVWNYLSHQPHRCYVNTQLLLIAWRASGLRQYLFISTCGGGEMWIALSLWIRIAHHVQFQNELFRPFVILLGSCIFDFMCLMIYMNLGCSLAFPLTGFRSGNKPLSIARAVN